MAKQSWQSAGFLAREADLTPAPTVGRIRVTETPLTRSAFTRATRCIGYVNALTTFLGGIHIMLDTLFLRGKPDQSVPLRGPVRSDFRNCIEAGTSKKSPYIGGIEFNAWRVPKAA